MLEAANAEQVTEIRLLFLKSHFNDYTAMSRFF